VSQRGGNITEHCAGVDTLLSKIRFFVMYCAMIFQLFTIKLLCVVVVLVGIFFPARFTEHRSQLHNLDLCRATSCRRFSHKKTWFQMTHDVLSSASVKAASVHLATSFVVSAEVSNAEKILVLLLSTHADDRGECRVRQEILAAEYGCSPRFVRRLLTQLRQKGFLEWNRSGRQNCYQLSATIVVHPPFLPVKSPKKRMSKAKKHPM
jgi:hypothetical protein